MSHPIDTDALQNSLDQAQGILQAVIDQACLNGPDVVNPAALIAAQGFVREAMGHAKSGPAPERVDSRQDNPTSEDRSALLSLEEPINLARGQAWTMYMAQEQDGKADPMIHAGQALFRTMDELFSLWDKAVHKN